MQYTDALKKAAADLALEGRYDLSRPIETPETTVFAIWERGVEAFLLATAEDDHWRFMLFLGAQRKVFFPQSHLCSYDRFKELFYKSARNHQGVSSLQ